MDSDADMRVEDYYNGSFGGYSDQVSVFVIENGCKRINYTR
jgi:hypothetical protein